MELDGLCINRLSERTYALEGHQWRGRVDAGLMTVAEDQGSDRDPSSLFSEDLGRDGAGPDTRFAPGPSWVVDAATEGGKTPWRDG